jgi:hypothetical protein
VAQSDIRQSDEVYAALKELDAVRVREDAAGKLSRLYAQLQVQLRAVTADLRTAEKTLRELRQQRGRRVRRQIDDLERKVRFLDAQANAIRKRSLEQERLAEEASKAVEGDLFPHTGMHPGVGQ